jgi:D-alanine-D-alanine ligase
VDIRTDPEGRLHVLEINSMASLGSGGSFVRAAEIAGYGFADLLNRIVGVAHERHFGVPAPPGDKGRLATSGAGSS